MGERFPRWTYVIIFALLVIVAALSVRALRNKKTDTVAAPLVEKTAQRDTDSERRVEELNGEVAQLRKENEENSNRVRELETKLADVNKALTSTQQKLKVAQRQPERPAP